jgi:hypothetical protein
MRTVSEQWSKWKWFDVVQSQIEYLLGSIICKLLITNELKSRFSYISLPNSFTLYSLLGYGIPVNTYCGT